MRNIILTIVLMTPVASWAQDIKPFDAKVGLWESSVTTEIAGMPAMPEMPAIPEETLAKMPPAQRAQVEAAMKGRGSMGRPQTTTNKFCISRESLNKPIYSGNDKTCTSKVVTSTSSTQKIHLDCTPSGMKATGDVTVERIDAEHNKGTMLLKTTSSDSPRSMDMKIAFTNKWVAADCGSVKPIGEK